MSEKTTDTPGATEASAPAARAHNAGGGGAVAGGSRSFSATRKPAAVRRLMWGESGLAVGERSRPPPDGMARQGPDWAESVLKERAREIRPLKEQLLRVRHFETVEDLRQALARFAAEHNASWFRQRHGHKTPDQISAEQESH